MTRLAMLLACGAVLSAAGCTATDPLYRQGLWHPNYANDADLRAMASQPSDLVRGQGAAGSSGEQAALAIKHLTEDKPKQPLTGGLELTGSASSGGS